MTFGNELHDGGFTGREHVTATKVLVFTQQEMESVFKEVLDAGALGLVLKREPNDVLVQAVRSLCAGQPFFSTVVQQLPSARAVNAVSAFAAVVYLRRRIQRPSAPARRHVDEGPLCTSEGGSWSCHAVAVSVIGEGRQRVCGVAPRWTR